MMLLLSLALKDLKRDWVYLFCNIAMLVGVIVPLLVLFGVRNGVYDALIGRLLSDPTTLQIDTRGNHAFSPADAVEIRGWPEADFVTLKTRSLFDYVNVRAVGQRVLRDAVLSPSGAGDPMLMVATLEENQVALSADLAEALGLEVGAQVELITQAPERPRQLVLELGVAAIVPKDMLGGRSVLANIGVLDLIEAFYDEYALPEYGIVDGRSLDTRITEFEGLRVFARTLEALAPLQEKLETRFGISTQAKTAQVTGVLGLGCNLGLALLLTTSVAGLGLAAALTSSFWAEVARKRQVLANMALLGFGPGALLLFPVLQALVTAVLGLVASFGLFAVAANVAETLFDTGLSGAGGLVVIGLDQGLTIAAAVLGFVMLAAVAAAWRAQGTDPAVVLRGA